jgi:hypothetical protein
MGIILREPPNSVTHADDPGDTGGGGLGGGGGGGGAGGGRIIFLMKGADSVMGPIVEFSDWLEEECENLARKGLRTLVIAMRYLPADEFQVSLVSLARALSLCLNVPALSRSLYSSPTGTPHRVWCRSLEDFCYYRSPKDPCWCQCRLSHSGMRRRSAQ